jgi:hypothetical protein
VTKDAKVRVARGDLKPNRARFWWKRLQNLSHVAAELSGWKQGFRADPGESTDVFTHEPDKAKELFATLKADIARGRSR